VDVIAETRRVIKAQLDELDSERVRLQDALAALSQKATGRKPVPARRAARAHVKRARRGQREAEFVADLTDHPNATVAEIAHRLGVAPQGLYPIARRLVANGSIEKSGHVYSVSAAPADANGSAPSAPA